MRKLFPYTLCLFFLFSFNSEGFKEEQLRYSRVRQAYKEKGSLLQQNLDAKNIKHNELELYIRAFKTEKTMELWGKDDSLNQFVLLKSYTICETSGMLGPKRQQGDLQIPEGYYQIDRFNPFSNFHLSLGLNYPNASDKILGHKGDLGGDIFIHGDCVTIGCLPLTDDLIKEVYLYCVEAKNNGQPQISVCIFPTHLTTENYKALKEKYANDSDKLNLWEDLKKGYDLFNSTHKLPHVKFLINGRHEVK